MLSLIESGTPSRGDRGAPPREPGVALPRGGQRAGLIERDETVQAAVERGDSREASLDQRSRGQAAGVESRRKFADGFLHVRPHRSQGSGRPIEAGIFDERPRPASTASAIK